MTWYRFTPEDFICTCGIRSYNIESHKNNCDAVKNRDSSNALLEQWEKESDKTHIRVKENGTVFFDNYVATLWNPQKIEEKK